MRFRIHHGAAEIGGNCIEVESGGRALLLDLGLPLDRAPVLPPIAGLSSADERLLGVVLSHPHLDHYGLLPAVRADLPVWLGEGARTLLAAASPFTAGAVLPQTIAPYLDRLPFSIGPFTITPYLMDHSAFDAHALLIEAGGKRLVYSGDFRGHGRKAQVFERFIADPPLDIDVLLMEGTTISRDEPARTEADVESEMLALMRAQAGLILTCFSAQNIDRFVTCLRATVRAGRVFVIDAYMANLIDALAMPGLPDIRRHPSVRIYLPRSQKRMIVRGQRFDLIEPYRAQRIYLDEVLARPARYAMMFRASMIPDLGDADISGGALIYSLWPGYLRRDRTDLQAWAHAKGLAFQIIHSSGHASVSDLRRMATAVNPKRLVPIHTDQPARYDALFERVQRATNGAWMDV